MPDTYAEWQRHIADALRPRFGVDAMREARYLVMDAASLSAIALLSEAHTNVPEDISRRIQNYLARRLAGEPLSRIKGSREFYGLRFALGPDTLDPRPDSETVIEAALAYRASRPELRAPRVLDLGTGSGCLLLTLLHLWPDATGIGVDLSPGAVAVATQNAQALDLAARACIHQGNWGQGLEHGAFDVILSNPPYIPSGVIPSLEVEVKEFDPILALDGGQDGLMSYKTLVHECRQLLTPTGAAFFEVGIGQAEDVTRLGYESGATQVLTHADSGGITRVVDIRYGDN